MQRPVLLPPKQRGVLTSPKRAAPSSSKAATEGAVRSASSTPTPPLPFSTGVGEGTPRPSGPPGMVRGKIKVDDQGEGSRSRVDPAASTKNSAPADDLLPGEEAPKSVDRLTAKEREEQWKLERGITKPRLSGIVGEVTRADSRTLHTLRASLERDVQVLQPARDSLSAFWKLTKPDMAWNWFNQVVADELERFLQEVLAGNNPRLMLFAPPRHGKTEGVSRRFPAWVFGRHPKLHIIACSYAAQLASRTNRDVQRVMDTQLYQEIFPRSRLNSQNIATLAGQPLRNSDIFEVIVPGEKQDEVVLGSYRSAGVGGGITGQGFDIGIIDDPIADARDAQSDAIMDSLWEWYQQVFYTRQSPRAGIVVMMTRWVTDDLAGRLLEEMKTGGEEWRVIKFPAIAEEEEQYRKVGEALCPERYSTERLTAVRKAVGEYTFSALYQQRPGPKGGVIFKRKHWQFWKVLPALEEIIISVDCTFKDLQDNDYVAIGVWGRVGANKYLVKRTRERMGFAATTMAVRATHALFPTCIAVLIEDKANGSAVIETLKAQVPGVIAVNPLGGKVARAYAIQPEQEAGNVWLPDPEIDNDIETFLGEASAFPGGAHDDEIDEMTQALNWFRTRGDALGMLHFMEQEVKEMQAKQKQEEEQTT